ncbi:hypothetical protein DDZ18_12510 [Marinicauda salina]|uniref:Uncharacterized protein n=1 Tax=Marinicauda salina TaxID=2135793 RepID=A0A2U2BRE2_9PROT|nr:hypothetical protein [Marinicauda salina]PWE16583.1 hypothetical protein DDZ18_12510 [Marinicauda salina]
MALGNFKRALSGLWVAEERTASPAGPAPDLAFRQAVEAWVEFKRLHLAFAQTLNSLIRKRSNLLQLIKFAMLSEAEAQKLTPQAAFVVDAAMAELIGALPIQRYAALYRMMNAQAFDDDALKAVLDPGNLKAAEVILKVVGDAPARADLAFVNLAERAGFKGAERAEKWSPEIARIHRDLLTHYRSALRSRGLI